MTRKESNMEIIKRLQEYFEKPENEDIRFFQGLSNLGLFNHQTNDEGIVTGIDDPHFQDSGRTLITIEQSMNI